MENDKWKGKTDEWMFSVAPVRRKISFPVAASRGYGISCTFFGPFAVELFLHLNDDILHSINTFVRNGLIHFNVSGKKKKKLNAITYKL